MGIHLLSRTKAVTPNLMVKLISEAGIKASCGPTIPNDADFIVNYGKITRGANINANIIYNKRLQLKRLQSDLISCPEILLEGDMDSLLWQDLVGLEFPFLGRKKKHSKGKDIVWIPDLKTAMDRIRKLRTRDFLVQYIEKKREFRVHIVGGRWVSVSEKIKDDDNGFRDPNIREELIWAHRYGWKHMVVKGDDEIRPELIELALAAAKSTNFEFGAVDVIQSVDGELYVLELNSAPSLNNRRAEKYVNYFISQYRGE